MYGESHIRDFIWATRAIISNVIARVFPGVYMKLARQTGRGPEQESAEEVAEYFERCVNEYFNIVNVAPDTVATYLAGKTVLEYGPGDIPGVGFLLYAKGAAHVSCVDRFSLVKPSDLYVSVIAYIIETLDDESRSRAISSLVDPNDIKRGFKPDCIDYVVRQDGLSSCRNSVDIVISRAVLEHVNDLSATFTDMACALKEGGVAIHRVDLRSHGLHRKNKLDFLTWPAWLWNLMYSGKGVPNRWRINRYIDQAERVGLDVTLLEPTEVADSETVQKVIPYLSPVFNDVTKDQLMLLDLWLVLEKRPNRLN